MSLMHRYCYVYLHGMQRRGAMLGAQNLRSHDTILTIAILMITKLLQESPTVHLLKRFLYY